MFRLMDLKIRNKLLITCSTLIVISNFIIGIPAVIISTNAVVNKAAYYIYNMLEQVSKNIDINLEQVELISYSLMTNSKVNSMLKVSYDSYNIKQENEIKNILTSAVFSRKDIDSIFLFNNQGYVWSTREQKVMNFETARVEADKGDGSPVWLAAQEINGVEIPMVRNINDVSTMKPIGVLLVYIRGDSIRKVFMEAEYDRMGADTYIINTEGNILLTTSHKAIGEKFTSDILKHMKGENGSFFTDTEGKKLVIFQTSRLNDWRYIYMVPYKELTKEIGGVQNWILFSMCIFTLASFLLVLRVSHNISKPIQQVVEEIDRINRDNFNINLLYDGKDEMGILVRSINMLMHKIKSLIKEVYEQKICMQEQEIKTLQAQINPHFLYNTLETINWMGKLNNVPEICRMTILLGDIMRYSINRKEDVVQLKDEIEYVQKYLSIQQMRYGSKLSVFYDIPDEICENIWIPKLIIQPIVENAIMHGIEKKAANGRIRIVGRLTAEYSQIIIEDDGAGMDEFEVARFLVVSDKVIPSTHTGIGIQNVNKRIKMHFGNSYGLNVISKKDVGTRVCINLPGI